MYMGEERKEKNCEQAIGLDLTQSRPTERGIPLNLQVGRGQDRSHIQLRKGRM